MKEVEKFFFACNFISTYHPIQQEVSCFMSEVLAATISKSEFIPPEQKTGSFRPELVHASVEEGEYHHPSSTELQQEFKEAQSQLGSVEVINKEIKLANIGVYAKAETALTYNTLAVYVNYETLPPVYEENGAIIIKSKRLKKLKPHFVILDNVRYVVIKGEKGDIDVYEYPRP